MATATLEPLENLNEKSIQQWLERFEAFCTLSKIENLVSALVTHVGAKAYNILSENLSPKSVAECQYAEIKKTLLSYNASETLVAVARYKFSKVQQQSNEEIQSLYHRLIAAAQDCKFDKNKDLRIRDQIIASMIHREQIQIVLQLKNDEYLKLSSKDLISKIQAIETITSGINIMVNKNNDVFYVNKRNNFIKNCTRCGRSHKIRECPAFGKSCNNCKKTGHFSNMCKQKKINKNTQKNKMNKEHLNKKSHNFIEDASDSSASILFLNSGPVSNNQLTLQINNQNVNFTLDTGANVSVIKYEKAKSIGLKVQPAKKSLHSFDGRPLKVMGCSEADVQWGGRSFKVLLYIIDTNSPYEALLGQDILRIFGKSIYINNVNQSSGILNITVDLELNKGVSPVFQKSRPIPFGLRAAVKEEIERLLALGYVEKINYSNWGTPIVCVKKSSGKIRLCGDYKVTLNPLLAEMSMPTICVEDLLAEIDKAKWFSKIDLEGAYLQLKLSENAKPLTTINTPYGLYQYTRLPFGVKTAPAIFQSTMLKIMNGISGIVIYLDDILVFANNLDEHNSILNRVLQRLDSYNVQLNKQKSIFRVQHIKFLGHILSAEGIKPNDALVKDIVNAPYPINKSQIQSFVGSVQYYSKFINNLADKIAPLTRLLAKNAGVAIGDTEKQCIDGLKQILTSKLVLKPYSVGQQCQLICDASPIGIGAVLQQEQHPVIFISKKLNAAERNYSQTEREALAIVWAVKRLQKFLLGRKFEIITDHKALHYVFSSEKASNPIRISRLHRWAVTLSAFDYYVTYKPAKETVVADFLSRNVTENNITENYVTTEIFENSPLKFKLLKIIFNCEYYKKLKLYIQNSWPNDLEAEFQYFYKIKDELSIKDELIYKNHRLVIPNEMIPLILSHLHESHLGIEATKRLAREHYFWPTMNKDIEIKVKSCVYCSKYKTKSLNKNEKCSWPFPRSPWERVHIDFFQLHGFYFLVVVDAFSKYPDVIITKNMSTQTVKHELQKIFSRFGIPNCIVSDNGPAFAATEFKTWLINIGCKHLTIAPYHPQSNGLAERFVRTMKEQLKEANTVEKSQSTINKFLICYRSLPHNSTGWSPAQLFFNRQIRTSHNIDQLPENVWVRNHLSKQFEPGQMVGNLGKVMKLVRKQDGTLSKHHLDQIKFNPNIYQPTPDDNKPKTAVWRSKRSRRPPDRYRSIQKRRN